MHRSGTSLIANLLQVCGVYLGEATELEEGGASNINGHFEHAQLMQINNQVLHAFGSAWDLPPQSPPAWHHEPRLIPLRNQAAQIIARLQEHPIWGWKDPRCALTLPFWQQLVPTMRVVVCLRNPYDVARSLESRNGLSIPFGLALWKQYYQSLLQTLSIEQWLITHYDSYFLNPHAELERLLHQLGIAVPEATIETAIQHVLSSERHHHASHRQLGGSMLPPDILELYQALQDSSNPLPTTRYQPAALADVHTAAVAWEAYYQAFQQLQANIQIELLQEQLGNAMAELASVKYVLAARDEELASIKPVLAARDEELASVKYVLAARDEELASIKPVLAARDEELASVKYVLAARQPPVP
jgi:hypothetical protein